MPVDKSNLIPTDLDDLYKRARISTQAKYRGNPGLPESIILTDSPVDRDLFFECFRSATTYVADKTSLYTTVEKTLHDGTTTMVRDDVGTKERESGAASLRENFLQQKITNIELFQIDGTITDRVRTVYYQYVMEALKHYSLSKYYKEIGLFEFSMMEERDAKRAISNINNVGTRPSFVKAKPGPTF